METANQDLSPSLATNSKRLIVHPLFYLKAMLPEEVATNRGRSNMKPYRKPTIADHDGDPPAYDKINFKAIVPDKGVPGI